MQMTHQAISPAVVTRFTSHSNACNEVLPRPRYAKAPKHDANATQTYGTPHLLTLRKTFGANPSSARPWSVLLERKVQLLPDENAEVRITALMIDGRTFTPARLNAMTKGEAAVPELSVREGSVEGTIMPMIRTETM
jgi:hypothetical protein